MNKSIVRVATLVALQGGTLFAQSLFGTWQGPLQVSQTPGDTLRVVFKISTTISGTLKGDMYSIDQGGPCPGTGGNAEGLGREDSHAVHRRHICGKVEP